MSSNKLNKLKTQNKNALLSSFVRRSHHVLIISWLFSLLFSLSHDFISAVHIWFISYASFTSYLSREHMNPKLACSQRQWLHSSVGRASHRYRKVTGSSPVEVLNFFQASLRNCKNCDHNCEDHYLMISYPQFTYDLFHMHHSLHIFHGNIWTQNWPAPNVSGFIAQLVERRTGIARSRVQAPLKSWIFFQASLRNCKNCDHNCEDHSSFDFISAVHIWFISYASFTSYLSREHMNPKLACSQRQWLHSSVGRASHRYREVTGSSPVEVLNFFQASLRNCKNCDHNCEDHSSFDVLIIFPNISHTQALLATNLESLFDLCIYLSMYLSMQK